MDSSPKVVVAISSKRGMAGVKCSVISAKRRKKRLQMNAGHATRKKPHGEMKGISAGFSKNEADKVLSDSNHGLDDRDCAVSIVERESRVHLLRLTNLRSLVNPFWTNSKTGDVASLYQIGTLKSGIAIGVIKIWIRWDRDFVIIHGRSRDSSV